MNRKLQITAGAALILLTILFARYFDITNPTALFGLLGVDEMEQGNEKSSKGDETVEAGLSFSILKKTELYAQPVGNSRIPDCPEETEIEIAIENLGSGDAEKVFVKFPASAKVIACENCKIDHLKAGQSATAKARLCREEASLNEIKIGSANSNTVWLGLGE